LRLPAHFVTNLYFGLDLKQTEHRKMSLQFNIENLTNRVYQIAKESEFTPEQFAPPRFVSGSLKFSF
jgi:outer membrane receptor protein involved in Fe transport